MGAKPEIQKIYALTPMQEGMLFHHMMGSETGEYFEQMSLNINGMLDLGIFKQCFNILVERYDVLRTIFSYKKAEKPLQIVLKQRNADIYFEDLSHRPQSEIAGYIEEFEKSDRIKGFDLSKDILMRISVLKTGEHSYRVIWGFHHMIMDGWCLGIIIGEFFQIYDALIKASTANLPKVKQFGEYLQWLENQDREEARAYWKQVLDGYTGYAGIPKTSSPLEGYDRQEIKITLDQQVVSNIPGRRQSR